MQFQGNHKGILSSFGTKSTKGDGVDISKAVVEIRMDKDELGKAVNTEFAAAVFSFLVNDEQQGLMWTTEPFTPKGTYSSHTLKMSGGKVGEVQPKIHKIKPVEGEAKVDVDVLLPFVVKDEASAGKLHGKVGSQVTVDLVVREPELPMGTKVVDGGFGNPKHVPA